MRALLAKFVPGGPTIQERAEGWPTAPTALDAGGCRRHYGYEGYLRGRGMSDRMDEIRSTRAPRLRTDQIGILQRYGVTRKTEVGEVLFRAGDTENDFIVVLEGEVKVGDDFPGETKTIGTSREGRFLGELNMLTGQAMYLTGVVSEAGEVLAISRERLKEVVTEEPNISDIILRAFLASAS
jgi:CRP-like cAMP-binding protein